MSGVKIKGTGEILARLRPLVKDKKEAVQKAILAEAFALQAESMKEVPVRYGRLRASAYTRPTETGAIVGYTAAYAVYVHEMVDNKHTVGKAKFLEDPMRRLMAGYLERITRRVLGGGGGT